MEPLCVLLLLCVWCAVCSSETSLLFFGGVQCVPVGPVCGVFLVVCSVFQWDHLKKNCVWCAVCSSRTSFVLFCFLLLLLLWCAVCSSGTSLWVFWWYAVCSSGTSFFFFGGVQCVPVGPVCDFFGGVQCVPVGHPLDQIKPNRFGATHRVWFPVCFGFTFFFNSLIPFNEDNTAQL